MLAIGLRHGSGDRLPSALIGKPAPAFSLESLGNPGMESGHRGLGAPAWLLNVWATWCPPAATSTRRSWQSRAKTACPWWGSTGATTVRLRCAGSRSLAIPYVSVAYDPDGRTAIDWGVYGAPETFLIDANGIVVKKYVGPMTMDVWQREFVPLLPAAGEGR